MRWTPCLVRSPAAVDGAVRVVLGDPLVDDYLEFVAARCRPNTVLATAYDLKVFFEVVGKEPVRVSVSDVLAFITTQRAPRRGPGVVRLEDGESGLSARTIKRRGLPHMSDRPSRRPLLGNPRDCVSEAPARNHSRTSGHVIPSRTASDSADRACPGRLAHGEHGGIFVPRHGRRRARRRARPERAAHRAACSRHRADRGRCGRVRPGRG